MVGMLKTTIDLSAIAHNVRLIKEKVGPEVKPVSYTHLTLPTILLV